MRGQGAAAYTKYWHFSLECFREGRSIPLIFICVYTSTPAQKKNGLEKVDVRGQHAAERVKLGAVLAGNTALMYVELGTVLAGTLKKKILPLQ